MNYFQLLGIDQKFNIDLMILNQNYLSCLAKFHPDRNNETDDAHSSAKINQAYLTLKDEFSRAEYLLSLSGIYINDTNLLKQDQLINLWEALEIVEDTMDLSVLENLYREKINNKEQLIKNIDKAFNNNDLDDALDTIINLKYIINLINNIKIKLNYANRGN